MVRIMQNSSSWHNYRWPSDASLFRVLGINHTCPCDGCSPAIHYYGALAPQDDNVVSRMMPTVGSPSTRAVLRGTLVQHVDSPLSTVAAGEESFWQHDGSRCCEEKPLSMVAAGEEPLVSLLREAMGKQGPRDGELPLLGRDAVNAPLVPIARVAMAAPPGPARRRWSPHSRPAHAVPGHRVCARAGHPRRPPSSGSAPAHGAAPAQGSREAARRVRGGCSPSGPRRAARAAVPMLGRPRPGRRGCAAAHASRASRRWAGTAAQALVRPPWSCLGCSRAAAAGRCGGRLGFPNVGLSIWPVGPHGHCAARLAGWAAGLFGHMFGWAKFTF
jgi:hypothetical protein